MDIDGMTLGSAFGYSNTISNAFRNDNDDYQDMLEKPELQNLLLLSDSLGSVDDVDISPFFKSPYRRSLSTFSGHRDRMTYLSHPNNGNTEEGLFSLSPSPEKCFSQGVTRGSSSKQRHFSPSSHATGTRKQQLGKVRRQNRSCDPCRSAKRACDLPSDPAISKNSTSISPCSTCKLRGTDCTVVWRTSKQSKNHVNHSSSGLFSNPRYPIGDSPGAGKSQSLGISSHAASPGTIWYDGKFVSDVMAREIRSQTLGVYIDIFDFPVSQLLSGGCMPPSHSLGISALTSLRRNSQLAVNIDLAQSMITDSWRMDTSPYLPASAIPRLFVTASILDMLFQRQKLQHSDLKKSFRDDSLTEVFKWVAIATGSQFAVPNLNAESKEQFEENTRGIAYAAWQKAKSMVFANIAKRGSFRLSLSLLLFGTILPPTGTEQSHELADESAYAFQEGVCRLRSLCHEARSYYDYANGRHVTGKPIIGQPLFKKVPPLLASLSTNEYEAFLELIAAIDWLAEISQAVAISIFPSRSFTFSCSCLGPGTEICHSVEDRFHDLAMKDLDDTIIARFKAETQPLTALWSQGAPEHMIQSAVSESGSLVVLLFKSLSRLTLATREIWSITPDYESIYRDLNTMIMLIGIWRTAFGAIDNSIAIRLQLATADLRRSVIFCAIDGDLAILLFHRICFQIEKHLTEIALPINQHLKTRLAETNDYRRLQRMTSAMQVSSLAVAVQGSSSLGVEGAYGLKAHIEDTRAHPHPTMVLQAYKLAANCLAEEIQHSVPTISEERISKLSIKLQSCLRELRGLRSTIVMYPSTDLGDENYE